MRPYYTHIQSAFTLSRVFEHRQDAHVAPAVDSGPAPSQHGTGTGTAREHTRTHLGRAAGHHAQRLDLEGVGGHHVGVVQTGGDGGLQAEGLGEGWGGREGGRRRGGTGCRGGEER